MDDGSIICIIPIVLIAMIIAILIASSQAAKKRKAHIEEAYQNQLRALRGFTSSQCFISVNCATALAVDEKRNLLALFAYNKDDSVSYRVFSAADVVGAELFQQGKSSSQVRNRAITGALLGSIFGDAGAVIGSGVAGSKAARDVDTVSVVLIVNDIQIPNHTIYFSTPSDKNAQALSRARRLLSILEIMIHRAESGQIAPVYPSEALEPSSNQKELPPVLPEKERAPEKVPACELHSAKSPRSYPIVVDQPTFTIGRSQTNDLILQDATVSRQHAELLYGKNGWMIQDQNSTAGCYVNGSRVSQQRLKDGDQLQIGSSVFIFREL